MKFIFRINVWKIIENLTRVHRINAKYVHIHGYLGWYNSKHEPSNHLEWHDIQTLSCTFFCLILDEINFCCYFVHIMTIDSKLSTFCSIVNKTVITTN
jgi:hypothetical protein